MWTKAKELLSHKNAITPAPGNNKKAHMVLSYSQVAPHLIQNKTDGQYICDDSCLQWKSSQICSHTLAAAQHNSDLSAFLQWYTQNADNPNISALAMIGLSRGRGRKGGVPKRQRTRKSLPNPDLYTIRPGLQPPGTCTSLAIASSTLPYAPLPVVSSTPPHGPLPVASSTPPHGPLPVDSSTPPHGPLLVASSTLPHGPLLVASSTPPHGPLPFFFL